jgi:hypothetical protein
MNSFHLGHSIVAGSYRLLIIEERRVTQRRTGSSAWLFAECRPHAVVVFGDGWIHCLDSAGEALALPALLARVPALAEHVSESSAAPGTSAT